MVHGMKAVLERDENPDGGEIENFPGSMLSQKEISQDWRNVSIWDIQHLGHMMPKCRQYGTIRNSFRGNNQASSLVETYFKEDKIWTFNGVT